MPLTFFSDSGSFEEPFRLGEMLLASGFVVTFLRSLEHIVLGTTRTRIAAVTFVCSRFSIEDVLTRGQ